MTITDQIRDILRASKGPLTVHEIHKLLPEKTLLTSVDAICWQRRRSGEFSRVSIGTRAGYTMNPRFQGQVPRPGAADEGAGELPPSISKKPADEAPSAPEPKSDPVSAQYVPPPPRAPRAKAGLRQVRVRPFIPARPEIMVSSNGPDDIFIQAHDKNDEEGKTAALIVLERNEIPALIRALAGFADVRLETILHPEAA